MNLNDLNDLKKKFDSISKEIKEYPYQIDSTNETLTKTNNQLKSLYDEVDLITDEINDKLPLKSEIGIIIAKYLVFTSIVFLAFGLAIIPISQILGVVVTMLAVFLEFKMLKVEIKNMECNEQLRILKLKNILHSKKRTISILENYKEELLTAINKYSEKLYLTNDNYELLKKQIEYLDIDINQEEIVNGNNEIDNIYKDSSNENRYQINESLKANILEEENTSTLEEFKKPYVKK